MSLFFNHVDTAFLRTLYFPATRLFDIPFSRSFKALDFSTTVFLVFLSKVRRFSVKRYLKRTFIEYPSDQKIESKYSIKKKKKEKKKEQDKLDLRVFTHFCLQNCSNYTSGSWKKTNWIRKIEKLWKFWEKFEIVRKNCSRDRKSCSTYAKVWDNEIRSTKSFLLWSNPRWPRNWINCLNSSKVQDIDYSRSSQLYLYYK